jgi:methylenetetrahydrofolate dehydrogenase (NADP+)/methenyltetrahydrofolate cyclohydrolase
LLSFQPLTRKRIGIKSLKMSSQLQTTQDQALMLDGARLAREIRDDVTAKITQLQSEHQVRPCLAAVRVGNDPASAVYVRNKIRACEEVGIVSEHHALPEDTSTAELLELLATLNARPDVDGILVQLPLPAAIDEAVIIEALDPAKDVDGFHPVNVGRLALGRPALAPCTPAGIVALLDHYEIPIRGSNVCVIGRSQIVGRPVAQLLLQRDATVTICHSRTKDLASITRQAEILVVAIGRAGLIGLEHIKPGATVIDVGMNRVSEQATAQRLFGGEAEKRIQTIEARGYTLVGDVNPAEARQVAGRLTPVPGGVGLLTVAMLMRNTLTAAQIRRGLV